MAKSLSDEFVKQNVTGEKIAGGLLDKGALHFAFKIEEMRTAEFFAMVIADLAKGSDAPSCYLPWSWTTSGAEATPSQTLEATDELYLQISERLRQSMPDATVVSIKRLENAEMYNAYFEVRQAVGMLRGGNPNERYLWWCGELAAGAAARGFVKSALPETAEHMLLGHGFMFAPDPRLADFVAYKGKPVLAERQLLLSRVTCGGIASRELLSPSDPRFAHRLQRSLPPPSLPY